jgi:hypothetical protein
MPQTERPNDEAAILGRLVGPDKPALSPAAAEGILALGLSAADKERLHTLAGKARAGPLGPDEKAEVEAYSRVGSLLGILKSKARRALHARGGSNGKATAR